MPLLRSFLFAPGNHARRVEKALGLDADCVILDLEDAVAIAEKAATRAVVAEALARPRAGGAYVRVNGFDTPFCYGDLCAAVIEGLDGIVFPKVESAQQLFAVDWLVGELERERGLEPGAVDLIPIVETARGLAAIDAIAGAGTRCRRIAFGAGDYTLDVGMRWHADERTLDHARTAIAVASRAAGLEPPLDTVWVRIGDVEGLEASAHLARDLGYQGKMCIHPEQVGPVNAAFSPTDAEIERARKIVAAFDAAEAAGSASIQVDGQFVDYPIVAEARRTLTVADAIAARGR